MIKINNKFKFNSEKGDELDENYYLDELSFYNNSGIITDNEYEVTSMIDNDDEIKETDI